MSGSLHGVVCEVVVVFVGDVGGKGKDHLFPQLWLLGSAGWVCRVWVCVRGECMLGRPGIVRVCWVGAVGHSHLS